MPNLHEWITIDYLGETKQVCKRCKQTFTPEKISEVCEGSDIISFPGTPVPVNQPVRVMAVNPMDFLKSLDADTIRNRIAELTGECEAWKLLLTVVEARDMRGR